MYSEKEIEMIEKLKEISTKYRPSNGSEGMWFEENFCHQCTHDDFENDVFCKTLGDLHCGEVEEIRQTKEHIFCLNDSNFDISEWQNEIQLLNDDK